MENNKIVKLMSVKPDAHDLCWLKDSLQAAIEVEMATLPPYLSALWSIKDKNDPVAQSILEIVKEEMLHMGFMCNLLTAIATDEAPVIKSSAPTYPGQLPGGVHPELEIPLQGLSPQAVKLFMAIELPEDGPIAFGLADAETYPTIGAFYTAILNAFERLQPPLSEKRQLEEIFYLNLTKLITLEDVRDAIELIKRQGEGSTTSPVDTGLDDLAHYYRFGEIDRGRKIRLNMETGQWGYGEDEVEFPKVWPMAPVPYGGYQENDTEPEVWNRIEQFDKDYTLMLDQLQKAWQEGSQGKLDEAIETMKKLREPAVALMKIQLPTGDGNYGPCFRLAKNS